jgi:MFS family permease
LAISIARVSGFQPLFYVASVVSMFAAISVLLIRPGRMRGKIEAKGSRRLRLSNLQNILCLIRDLEVRNWLACLALFHVATGPMGAMVGLYMQHIGSTEAQIAWTALMAQPLTIPAAWMAGRVSGVVGRKPVFALAFLLLPLRIWLYTLTTNWVLVLGITAIDGIISGIYGVLVLIISSDLTRGKTGFNSLVGLVATMPALGAMLGALIQGALLEKFGFRVSFFIFAATALAAAVLFLFKMRETLMTRGAVCPP